MLDHQFKNTNNNKHNLSKDELEIIRKNIKLKANLNNQKEIGRSKSADELLNYLKIESYNPKKSDLPVIENHNVKNSKSNLSSRINNNPKSDIIKIDEH